MAKHILMLPERFHSDVKIIGRGDLTIFVIDHAYITSQYKDVGEGGVTVIFTVVPLWHALAH